MQPIYRLFAYLLAYPTSEVLEGIKQASDSLAPRWLQSPLRLTNRNPTELEAEYTHLFVNSFPELLCPPYESYYREGVVYGDAANQVAEIYRKHGLSYSGRGEPPDHISVELDFLAETGDLQFLSRFREWAPQFVQKVKNTTSTYRVVAEELETYIIQNQP